MHFSLAKDYIPIEFDKIKKDAHETNKWVRERAYDKIINHAHEQYNMPEDTKLSKKKDLLMT